MGLILVGQLQAEVEALRGKQAPSTRPQDAPAGEPGTPDRGMDQTTWNISATSPASRTQTPASQSLPGWPTLAASTCSSHVPQHKPPADLVFSLVALYFRHIHPWIPFLDAQRVFGKVAVGADPPLLCYALFGISLPFSLDSRLTLEGCDSFWKYAKRKVFIEVLEEPSYSSLEALSILVLDLSGMTHGPQVWGALAIAVRLAVQLRTNDGRVLRMSFGGEGHADTSWEVELSRRRLFWAIFTLDCYISITTGQPSQLADCYLSYFIPLRPAMWSGDGVMDKTKPPEAEPCLAIFNHQLRLLVISRDIHASFLKYIDIDETDETSYGCWLQAFNACSDKLEEWLASCPEIQRAHDNPEMWAKSSFMSSFATLYAYKHALGIFLHGVVAYSSTPGLGSQLAIYQARSRQKCAEEIENLARMVALLRKEDLCKLGWPFSWAVWVAARYILIAEHGGGSIIPQRYFSTFLACLRETGRYWQISKKYWWLLRRGRAELNGSTVSGNSVLRFLVDQRATTGDLEDRFSRDPFFNENGAVDLRVSELLPPRDAEQQVPAVSVGDDANLRNDLALQDMGFLVPNMASEMWFPGPLHPISAFQPHFQGLYEGWELPENNG